MFKKLTEAARSLKDRADVDGTIEATQRGLAATISNAGTGVAKAWEQHWPALENEIVKRLLTGSSELLGNEDAIESFFSELYGQLPAAARLVLPRDTFITMAMSRRADLYLKVQESQTRPRETS